MSDTQSAAKRGMTLDDLARIEIPNDPQISPDGAWVVWSQQRMDRKKDKYFANLWIAPADGSAAPRALTVGDHKDIHAVWAPDSTRLAFVSTRDGASNIWMIRRDGGEAVRVTDLHGDIDALTWSPDGATIAYTFRPEDPPLPADPGGPEPSDADKSKPPRYRHITRLHYKEDGIGFLPQSHQHLYVLSIDGCSATGEPRQVTDGDYDDTHPTWAPDGQHLAFFSKRMPDAEYYEAFTHIYRVPAAGGAIEQLTHDEGDRQAMAYSPDGKWLAYIGHTDPTDGGCMINMHPWVIPSAGGAPRDLTPAFDRSALNSHINDLNGAFNALLAWSPDGGTVYFFAVDRGAVRIFRVPFAGGMPEPLTGEREYVYAVTADARAARFAFGLGTPSSPGEICVLDVASGARRVLTDVNPWLRDEIELAEVEEFTVAGAGGPIHGWRVRPPRCLGLAADAKLPAFLHIHGGPHCMYGWGMVHEFQMLAARGFVVVWTNPRGGQGYGQEWVSAIKGAWGGVDYDDLMTVADAMAAWPFVDAARLGVGGGSYGGYMTNWIVGHTDRFKAAITMRSISNLHSDSGTSDFGYFDAQYWGAHTWDDPQRFLDRSPITYVKNVRTPLLILHSENDHRCPVEQAEQFYTALKYLRQTVEFVRYPEESHGITRGGTPSRRFDHQARTRDWLERFLGPVAGKA